MAFSQQTDPQFSQPIRQIVMMLIVLGLVIAGSWLIYPAVAPVFLASPYLNGFIFFVFVVGVAACFWQVFTLVASVSWIENFVVDRPGHEFTKAPRLLASLAALLSQRRARRALTASSSQSILDSVGTRVEEQRDLTRYLINLLIFLGLLGTFYGLATVVPAVVDTIRSLAPQEGQSAIEVFDNLMSGLEEQLSGMGTAFASSLLGLAGSLVVGLLELFASHAQNRFYRDLEEWLSAKQIDELREVVEQGVARTAQTETRLSELAEVLAAPQPAPVDNALLERIAASQERVAALLEARDEDGGGMDAETRARLRSIDTQVLRILEDLAAGRQDLVTEIRHDIAGLSEALRAAAGQRRY